MMGPVLMLQACIWKTQCYHLVCVSWLWFIVFISVLRGWYWGSNLKHMMAASFSSW